MQAHDGTRAFEPIGTSVKSEDLLLRHAQHTEVHDHFNQYEGR